jgi:riboflavin kinase/FMN adenylyltransferase
MDIFRSLDEAQAREALRGCAVAIGNFDGVHLGHQRLLALARTRAAARRARAAVLTFEPHPVRVLRPALAPPLVTSLARKLELLAGQGLDAAVVHPFDLAYARTPAREFVERDLAGRLGAAEVVVGYDFTAGHERARVEALRPLLAAAGILLHVVEPVAADGLVVSSTKIREFLLEGNVEAAALLLTRPYDLDGTVTRGAGRGRGFGFATANVSTAALLPANGVYVVRAVVGPLPSPASRGDGGPGTSPLPSPASRGDGGPGTSGRAVHGGVCNVGVKPTVETGAPVVAEAHLFDFDGRDLYGEPIRLAFLGRLRDERRFPSVGALRAQIAEDVARARAALAAAP